MKATHRILMRAGLFLLLSIIGTAFAETPSINIQNDTDNNIEGSYNATILNDHAQTNFIQDTFPAPPGRSATPPLPYYLLREHVMFTDNLEGCESTVGFDVENRGGSFYILQPSSLGTSCNVEGQTKKLSGTVLPDGFTILLLEVAG